MADTGKGGDLTQATGLPATALTDLAVSIQREHDAGATAAVQAMEHWIRAGELLVEARERVTEETPGGWTRWVEQNLTIALAMVGAYIRVACYAEELRSAADAGSVTSMKRALHMLEGLPPAVDTNHHKFRYPPEMHQQARELRESGLSTRAIAEGLGGVSRGAVERWLDPTRSAERQRRSRRQRVRAQKALEREERVAEIRRAAQKIGGSRAEAYTLANRLDQVLGRAREEASTYEERVAINEAHAARDRMMDAIVRALGIS